MATQKAGTGKPHHETDMTDHLHLINQIAHHDAAISSFGSRMTAVESTLGHVQDKVSAIDNRMQTGFAAIEGLIREGKAERGPGLVEIVKLAVALVALCAAGATVITFLVSSQVAPTIQKLEDKTSYLGKLRDRDEEAREREFESLQSKHKDTIERKLEGLHGTLMELQTNRAWNQITINKGVSK